MWQVKSVLVRGKGRMRGKGTNRQVKTVESIHGYADMTAIERDGWVDMWCIVNSRTGTRKVIGRVTGKGKNWYDVASAEAARRNALLG